VNAQQAERFVGCRREPLLPSVAVQRFLGASKSRLEQLPTLVVEMATVDRRIMFEFLWRSRSRACSASCRSGAAV
jgi:hypothetical protein